MHLASFSASRMLCANANANALHPGVATEARAPRTYLTRECEAISSAALGRRKAVGGTDLRERRHAAWYLSRKEQIYLSPHRRVHYLHANCQFPLPMPLTVHSGWIIRGRWANWVNKKRRLLALVECLPWRHGGVRRLYYRFAGYSAKNTVLLHAVLPANIFSLPEDSRKLKGWKPISDNNKLVVVVRLSFESKPGKWILVIIPLG